jgi:hypothetical protein
LSKPLRHLIDKYFSPKILFPDIYKVQAVLTSNKNSGLQNQNLQSFSTASLAWRLQKKIG